MKTRFALILIALLATATVSCVNHAGDRDRVSESEYPMTARVIDLNRDTDTVTVETSTGFTYAFYGCEDYLIGDCVSAIMTDKGTPEITDDEFVTVRYSGWSDYPLD